MFSILWRPPRSCWTYCFVFILKELFKTGNILFDILFTSLSFLWSVSHEFHDLALFSLLPLQPHMERCILGLAVRAVNHCESQAGLLTSVSPSINEYTGFSISTVPLNKMTCFNGGKSFEMISQGCVYYVRGIIRKKLLEECFASWEDSEHSVIKNHLSRFCVRFHSPLRPS